MKDPTKKHLETDYVNGMGAGMNICHSDGEEWPCTTIEKWRESKSYRIQVLEENIQTLIKSVDNLRQSVNEQRETIRRDGVYRAAMLDWLTMVKPGGIETHTKNHWDEKPPLWVEYEPGLITACTFEARFVSDDVIGEWHS